MRLKKDFGSRIKYLRKKTGITQEKLAEIVGIDAKHISHIETGRSFPKAELIEKFATALNIDYKELFLFDRANSREIMINEINESVQKTDEKLLKIIHKIVLDIVN